MTNIAEKSIDVILTSPFYNTNKKQGKNRTLANTDVKGYSYIRYDTHLDNMTDDEYKVAVVSLKLAKPNIEAIASIMKRITIVSVLFVRKIRA